MKMKLLLLLANVILLPFVSVKIQAQGLKQNIRGQVVDLDSKVPLIGVSIHIQGSNPIVGAVTNPDGNFILKDVRIGRYNLVINYMGYQQKVVSNLLVSAGKEAVLNIELEESVTGLEEVVVVAQKEKGKALNDMALVSARSFTVEETQRFAGSFSDPSRMVSSYAGVVGDPDGNNDIIIRGNSPKGLLWRVEGIEVPNPNHFANEGATGGPISILNSTTLSNSDFLTGAFPAEYGDAYSGVFDIKLRKGNNQQQEYTVQAGVIGIELAAEGPFSANSSSSYLFNYRYSSLDLLNKVGIKVAGDAVPKFQDFTFNTYFPTNGFGNFQLFGIAGNSKISFDEDNFSEDMDQYMTTTGLIHVLPLSKKMYLRSSLSLTTSLTDWMFHEIDDDTKELQLQDQESFDYINYRASVELNHKLSAKHTVKYGAVYHIKQYDLSLDLYNNDTESIQNIINQNGNTGFSQNYVAWKFRPVENATFNAGLHYSYLQLNGNQSLEPRIGVNYKLNSKHAISAGYGKHSKMETVSFYLAKAELDNQNFYQPNKELDLLRANHFVLGYNYRISPNLNLKMELYYQDLYDVPVEDDINSSLSAANLYTSYEFEPFVNMGKGQNYGTEITIERFFDKNYYFLFTSSLFESNFTARDGKKRNTRFNSGYVLNFVGGKEIPLGKNKNNALAFNIRATYAGGQYYSPIDPVASAEKGRGVRPLESAFSAKRSDYLRSDIKISFRRNKKHTTRVWELDIQNVTNSLNVSGDYWDNDLQEIAEYTQLGLLPVINYRIQF